jgi:hypothetical protein
MVSPILLLYNELEKIVEYAMSIINPDKLPKKQFIAKENIRIFNARCSRVIF